MPDNVNITVNETIENVVINPSISTDVIDVNTYSTTENVNIAVTPELTTININSVTSSPQVNSDWNATSGVAQILNKPTIPSIAGLATTTYVDTQDALKVDKNTAITGATKTKITYDSKGLVTLGADATTADIADSSNKRYQTDNQQSFNDATSSIQTQLNAKQSQLNGTGFVKASGTTISYDNSVYAPIIAKDFVNSGVSGTTVNTIIRSYLIPSNTFVLNDSLDILCSVFKNTTSQNVTLRVYFNTTVSLTGATLVGNYALSTTTKFVNFQRTNIYTGSGFYCFPPTASGITDRSITNVDLAVVTFNNLVDNYIIFAIQLSNSSDGGYIGGIRITK